MATVPWDAYLIRCRIWTYPLNAIIGPVLFGIPYEEVFFIVIQTYTTTLIYLLLNKPVLHAVYLTNKHPDHPGDEGDPNRRSRRPVVTRTHGQLLIVLVIVAGWAMVRDQGRATYLGLILVWAGPFALLLWWVSLSVGPPTYDGGSA